MTNRLKPKQQAFIDCTLLIYTYRTITDALRVAEIMRDEYKHVTGFTIVVE